MFVLKGHNIVAYSVLSCKAIYGVSDRESESKLYNTEHSIDLEIAQLLAQHDA